MTTSELIDRLRAADPEGNTHISCGGTFVDVYVEPGFYDGPYSYINEDGKYEISDKGNKVVIINKDLQDFVYDLVIDSREKPTLDEVFDKIIFNIGKSSSERLKSKVEKYYKEALDILEEVDRLKLKNS